MHSSKGEPRLQPLQLSSFVKECSSAYSLESPVELEILDRECADWASGAEIGLLLADPGILPVAGTLPVSTLPGRTKCGKDSSEELFERNIEKHCSERNSSLDLAWLRGREPLFFLPAAYHFLPKS